MALSFDPARAAVENITATSAAEAVRMHGFFIAVYSLVWLTGELSAKNPMVLKRRIFAPLTNGYSPD